MIQQYIVPENLSTFDYYKKLIPMYLQESFGFVDQYKLWYDIGFKSPEMTEDTEKRESSIISTVRDIFNSLNIFSKNDNGQSSNITSSSTEYLAFLNTIRESSTETEVIDKLAHLYGVSRNFSVKYSVSGTTTTKELNLTDEALMLLIKCQVIKNAYRGTFEQLKELYSMIGLPVMIITEGLDESTGNYKNAHCRLILLRQTDTDYTGADNPLLGVEDMFLAGLLTIQSLGIKYTYELYTASNIAIFDSTDTNRVFDAGSFVR